MRGLIIYVELSTDIIDPLKRGLEYKYDNPTIYHVPNDGVEDFIYGKREFDLVFFDESINETSIKKIFLNNKNTKLIKGIPLKDKEIAAFIKNL